jgi:hypothetical protein
MALSVGIVGVTLWGPSKLPMSDEKRPDKTEFYFLTSIPNWIETSERFLNVDSRTIESQNKQHISCKRHRTTNHVPLDL